jgi:hypothetical protein
LPANFTYATLADAQSAVSARLYDNGVAGTQPLQFWTAAELTLYIQEALRVWNSLTSFWRNQFAFNLRANVNWYDLTKIGGTLRPNTVTDQYLANVIEYHLLEPQTSLTPTAGSPATWTGSNQFRLSDIYAALTRRGNEVLTKTGCTITQSSPVADLVRRTTLPDTTLDIRRVAWVPAANSSPFVTTPLRQSDTWELRSFNPNYIQNAGAAPSQWVQSSTPPPSFDVDQIPPVDGTYDVLTVNSGPVSNATSAQTLTVPDDWTWIVKWGALADLLSKEANAKDAARAQFCQSMFDRGCLLLENAPATLDLTLNELPLFVDSVRNGDDFNGLWQASTPATPQSCYQSGLNMLGFPTPDAGPYSALVTVVQNAPVPVSPGDYIQVSRGDYDSIIDFAQVLAAFKMGGAEFAACLPLLQKFFAQAALYNRKLEVMGQFSADMFGVSQREERRNRRVVMAR